MYDEIFLSILIFTHCSSSLMMSSTLLYADDITLEAAALDTPNNVAIIVADVPAKRTPTVFFQNRTSLPFSNSFTRSATNALI
jgi:hypothetical protein